jgi:hypothetical protein
LDTWTSIHGEIGNSLTDDSSIALVGHDPGISTLLSSITGKRCRIIERGEAVEVIGLTANMGHGDAVLGKIFGSTYSSELVRKKLELKMTVSIFLAGFTIPMLVELVKNSGERFSAGLGLATVLFTLALGLFVASVYTYDALLMPAQYWGPTTKRKVPEKLTSSDFAHDYRLNGPLYAYMIRTWKLVFTPGVVCTATAFLQLLVDHIVKQPSHSRLASHGLYHLFREQEHWALWVFFLCLLAIGIAIAVYALTRLRLGIED